MPNLKTGHTPHDELWTRINAGAQGNPYNEQKPDKIPLVTPEQSHYNRRKIVATQLSLQSMSNKAKSKTKQHGQQQPKQKQNIAANKTIEK